MLTCLACGDTVGWDDEHLCTSIIATGILVPDVTRDAVGWYADRPLMQNVEPRDRISGPGVGACIYPPGRLWQR